MMNIKNNIKMRDFYFTVANTIDDAFTILMYADDIAETYGYVTLADMRDLVGVTNEYTDSHYGWTASNLANATVEEITKNMCAIHMPPFDWFYDKKESETKMNFPTAVSKLPDPEPINVTISISDPEPIEQIISAIFENADLVKDRPLFINIM